MKKNLVRQCERCFVEIENYSPFPLCEVCFRIVVKEFFSKKNDKLTIKEFREKIEIDKKGKTE